MRSVQYRQDRSSYERTEKFLSKNYKNQSKYQDVIRSEAIYLAQTVVEDQNGKPEKKTVLLTERKDWGALLLMNSLSKCNLTIRIKLVEKRNRKQIEEKTHKNFRANETIKNTEIKTQLKIRRAL